MKIGEAKNKARALWGDRAMLQVLAPRFQIIVPGKAKGQFVLVGEGEDWETALVHSKKNRNELAEGVIADRERKPWYRRVIGWFKR